MGGQLSAEDLTGSEILSAGPSSLPPSKTSQGVQGDEGMRVQALRKCTGARQVPVEPCFSPTTCPRLSLSQGWKAGTQTIAGAFSKDIGI
jgi:hypothetical protein